MDDSLLAQFSIIDLSVVTRPASGGDIEVWSHEKGAERLSRNACELPGYSRAQRWRNRVRYWLRRRRVRAADLNSGVFLRNEFLRLSTHAGTHLDAPFHYGPTCAGAPAKRVADVPLDWCITQAIVVDVRQAGARVRVGDVERACAKRSLAGKTVLFYTATDELFGTSRYVTECPTFDREAIEYLLNCGVRVVGVDSWSLDGPAVRMVDSYFQDRDGGHLWPVHMLGRAREFLQLENLHGLGQLPPDEAFWLICLPVKLADAGGAWTRAVALVGTAR